MKTFEIWSEGYQCTGNSSGAHYFGEETANSFKEACIRFFSKDSKHKNYFDPDKMTYWGCRLFDNDIDARKSFG